MPIDPNIILQGMPQGIDVNALAQQQMQGLQNINTLERQRRADAMAMEDRAAQQAAAQEQAALRALTPAVAMAFSDPSDAGLDAAFSMVPEEYAGVADEQLAQLRAITDVAQRKAIIRGALLQDDYGKALLAQLEPTANMRLQAETATRRAALDERRLALDEARLAAEAEGGRVSPDAAARLAFDREKLAAEQEEKARIASGEAAPAQLQKGERWNPETQRVEAVPGSQIYNKQKAVQATDYGAARNALRELEKVKGVVSELKNTTGYQKTMGTGVVMSNLPNIPGVAGVTGAYDFQTKYKNLKGSVATLGRAAASLQGRLGNMAVQEWKLVSDAIANLDLDTMDADVLDDQLNIIANDILRLEAQVRDAYENEWSGTQFYAPLDGKGGASETGGGVPTISTEEDFDALPSGAEFIDPEGNRRRKP